jgi:hypothetical protein
MIPSFLLISQFFIIYIDPGTGKRFATGKGWWLLHPHLGIIPSSPLSLP